jgi:hypothetical protein
MPQAKAAPKRRALPIGCIIALVIVVGAIGVFAYLNFATHPATLAVTDMNWSHKIDVQVLRPQSGSDWQNSVPGGAYNVSCHSQDRCHTESEQYVCGSNLSDNGDGSGSKSDKYCTRDKQVCVSDNMCNYTVDRWVFEQTLTASGGVNDTPHCPPFSPLQTGGIGSERGTCEPSFNVLFKDVSNASKTYTYTQPDQNVWNGFHVGQQYTVGINGLNIPSWNSLKLASNR